MKVTTTSLPEVLILEPVLHGDSRGFFMESFNQRRFVDATGVKADFVQDNHSRSTKGVLRGLHYQVKFPQGKLVRVTRGAVFDVAVDIRTDSPNFGKWFGLELSEENRLQLWVPPGFAHGFLVLSETADFLYKTTNYYDPTLERCIRWDDVELGINWPLQSVPSLSAKDDAGGSLQRCYSEQA